MKNESGRNGALVIASSANERYALGLAVMMCSVVLNHRGSDIRFYIVDDGILPETKEMIAGKMHWLSSVAGVEVETHYLPLSSIRMPHVPAMQGNYATYARMFLPELLEESSTYYVDSDILCNRAFPSLAEMESLYGGQLIAGCRDDETSLPKDHVWTEMSCGNLYVNAGFLWMNLKLMREMKWMSLLGEENEIMRKLFTTTFHFHDQTMMNCMCAGRISVLPENFNIMGASLHPGALLDLNDNWHFTGEMKPWLTTGRIEHLVVPSYLYQIMAEKIGLAHRLPVPYLPLSRAKYWMRHFIAARLWFRSRKRFNRFQMNVKTYQYSKIMAHLYAGRIENLLMR